MSTNYQALFESIHKLTGVYLQPDKAYLLDTRLSHLMKEHECSDFDHLSKKLDDARDRILIDKVIENITTHETRFFRDESIFRALTDQIIPEWLDRNSYRIGRGENISIDIMSAGSSTGQEAYSIAMSILEKFPKRNFTFRITGTDVSKSTVEKAKSGEYTEFEKARGVNEEISERYFEKSGPMYRVKDVLKNNVTFKVHNILTDDIPGMYDIIFFRNVSIYFEEKRKKGLFEKIRNSLRNDGILILGSAESLSGYLTNYVIRECGSARYYEINPSTVTMFK
ncbi:MAG: protein-glutamate O-methyltransferase CheR [Leptospira sp.]|nr:protein-glutamate O-methyltransferase CheR [Leptospira sp.]